MKTTFYWTCWGKQWLLYSLAGALVSVRNYPKAYGRILIFYHDTLTQDILHEVDWVLKETGAKIIEKPKVKFSSHNFRKVDRPRFENLYSINGPALYLDADAYLSSNWKEPKDDSFIISGYFVNHGHMSKNIAQLVKEVCEKLEIKYPNHLYRVNLGAFWSPSREVGVKVADRFIEFIENCSYAWCMGEFIMTNMARANLIKWDEKFVQDLGVKPAHKIYKEEELWSIDGDRMVLHAHYYNKSLIIHGKQIIVENEEVPGIFLDQVFEEL